MMNPTPQMIDAYNDGVRCRDLYASEHEAAHAEIYSGGLLAEIAVKPVAGACWRAGFYDHEMPRWATGWRYGHLPECGTSHNFRDDRQERGVSMMVIDGMPDRSSASYEMFNGGRGRERIRCAGWLIESRGSDGEYLLVGAVEL